MPVFKTSLATATYEPHPPYDERAHYLRKSQGPDGRVLRAGFMIAEVQDDVLADGLGDDNVFVLEGHAIVETGEGETIDLRPGDFASFPKGVKQAWRIVERFRAAFVYVE
jgi:ethanolamine utilization protein EutQ (cupin superfamily)